MQLHVKGRHLASHDMQLVLEKLYKLKQKIDSGKCKGKKKHIIGLVTILEQFSREVTAVLFRKYPEKIPTKIEVDTRILTDIIENIRGDFGKLFLRERIISQGFGFQSIESIDEVMKKCKIQFFKENGEFLGDKSITKQDYKDLFDMRHENVHSLESRSFVNLEKYAMLTEKLIDYVLDQLNYIEFINDRAVISKDVKYENADKYNKQFEKLEKEIETLYKAMEKKLDNKEYNKIVVNCNEILKIIPDDLFACYHKGLAYYKLGQYDKAVKVLNHDFKLVDLGICYLLGKSYRKLGEHEKAVECFAKLYQIKPNRKLYKMIKSTKKE